MVMLMLMATVVILTTITNNDDGGADDDDDDDGANGNTSHVLGVGILCSAHDHRSSERKINGEKDKQERRLERKSNVLISSPAK